MTDITISVTIIMNGLVRMKPIIMAELIKVRVYLAAAGLMLLLAIVAQ